MAETSSSASARPNVWAALAAVLLGLGLWVTQPFLEGPRPPSGSPPEDARAPQPVPESTTSAGSDTGSVPEARTEAPAAPDEVPPAPATAIAPRPEPDSASDDMTNAAAAPPSD